MIHYDDVLYSQTFFLSFVPLVIVMNTLYRFKQSDKLREQARPLPPF